MTTKIIKAWWVSSHEIAVVFNRDITFVPNVEVAGASFLPQYQICRASSFDFAKYSSYFISDGLVHFLLDDKNFQNIRSTKNAEYYVCGDFNGWGKAIGNPKWLMKPSRGDFERRFEIPVAELELKRRTGYFKFAGADGRWLEPISSLPNVERDKFGNFNLRLSLDKTGLHVFVISFDGVCSLGDKLRLNFPQLSLSTDVDFAERLLQIYSASQLGAYFSGGKTYFSVFAPRATAAYVLWGREGENLQHVLEAVSYDGAVWTASAAENLSGARYYWHINGQNSDNTTDFSLETRVADPYANAMLTSDGPSIVKFDECLPHSKCYFKPPHWHDLVVMEIHLRDVLAKAKADISDGGRLTFEGLAEWLSSEDCYLRKSGANCIEIQPIQEFTAVKRTDYEWGYMPVNWFSPSSSYASSPATASQNEDFAKLVDAFHKAGLAVILDVVYNHVGEPNYLVRLDKEYYFELDMGGNLMNFSGCGNDYRAKSPMARRMIIDSLKKLVLNYGVDGFRFDLAELVGFGVLRDIEHEMKKINPAIILIAEPWSFRGHIANALRDTGYASWNDGFREFMLSYVLGKGDVAGFKYFMSGSRDTSRFCAQTVNYLESHDDKCFFDRITTLYDHPSLDDIRRYKMGYALVMLSVGIPMAAEGFDLLRTKYGKDNTYKDGDANALDYSRGMRFTGVCQWLRSLVKFRLSSFGAALRIDGALPCEWLKFYVAEKSTAAAVMFNSCRCGKVKRIFAAYNPTDVEVELAVDAEIESRFLQIADIDRFDVRGLDNPQALLSDGMLTMPRVSFALWIEK